jgi:hypothetical protein
MTFIDGTMIAKRRPHRFVLGFMAALCVRTNQRNTAEAYLMELLSHLISDEIPREVAS